MNYIVYIFILFFIGCSMSSNTNIKNQNKKINNIEFKIKKKIGVQIND